MDADEIRSRRMVELALGEATMGKRIAALEADRDQLRSTILRMIRFENKCSQLGENCTGWDAEKCGCAVEARLNVKLES